MEKVYEMEYKGYNIEIYPDEIGESPREWDNLGKMLCFHDRYNLGDNHDIRSEDFESWGEVEEYLKKELEAVIILPLYLYDHSGITISTSPFSCQWDSGQIGFVYITKEDLKKEGVSKAKAKKILEGEIKIYDDYIRGNVYGYKVIDEQGNEIDSCWGFIGEYDDNYIIDEAKGIIDYEVEEKRKQKQKKTKGFIKNKVGLNYRR